MKSGESAQPQPRTTPLSAALVLLDDRDVVAAASDAFFALSGLARTTLGRPVSELLYACEARLGLFGWAHETLAALKQARRSSTLQVGPEFELPGRGARKARVVLSPLIGTTQMRHGVSLCFEELSDASLQLEQLQREWHLRVRERTAALEYANDRLLREIADHMRTEKQLALAQEQLSHARRLEAVGRLAGGIAHDFNNMLSVVLGYSMSMIEALPQGSTMRSDLEEIKRAGDRATELTRQLLAFGRQQVLNPKVLDLNEVISDVERMLRRVLGEDVELVTKLTSPLWKVKVDRGQIEQVLTNLMVNARDAMPQGGKLTIESAHAVFDEVYTREHPGAATGPHVVIAVSDTGMGMDKQTQERAFEPFFTTKEQGKGSGLGLATVFGTVKQSGGHIWLYSELGRGTTFKLCFPRCDAACELSEPNVASQRVSLPRGNETILLVEDDPQLRALACNILLRQGYQVIEAAEPGAAIEISAGFSRTIDLMLTDVVMPRMSGRELAQRLSETRPHMRVLFMSGYTDNAIVHHGILDPAVEFLQKPLTPDALTKKVRAVLDGND